MSTATRRTSSSRTGWAATSTTGPPRSSAAGRRCSTTSSDDPTRLANQLDWVAKRQILEGYRSRDGLEWSDARLQLVDLQYSDVRPDKGLYHRLVSRGRMERVLSDDAIARAVHEPPEDTRAWFRGECVRRYGSQVAAASWDSVIFDVPGRASLQRVPMLEPLQGNAGARRCPARSLPDRSRAGRRPDLHVSVPALLSP